MSWDKKFSADHYLYGTDPNDFLAERAPVLPKGKVLCIGDGEGRNGVYLATQGYDVTSVDSSNTGLLKAQKLASDKGTSISTVVADLNDFDMGTGEWDGIVSIFCHLPPPLRHKVHSKVVQALKPGGVLLLEAYTPKQLTYKTGGPPVAALMYTADILRDDFAGLTFEHLQELDRKIIEGTGHSGMGAVVQAIAVKP